jgi:hypothetical protein
MVIILLHDVVTGISLCRRAGANGHAAYSLRISSGLVGIAIFDLGCSVNENKKEFEL